MATLDDYERMVRLFPPTTANKLTVVPAGVIGDQLFHISISDKIKKFVPVISHRTGNKENRSVPRVSTAPTLLGCFIGYVASRSDFIWGAPDSGKAYRQGWYVYRIPFEFALRPTSHLLYDQENSDEHWLVTASEDTREYKTEIVAKCFYSKLTLEGRSEKRPFPVCTLYVDVMNGELPFGQTTVLTQGQWKIEGPDPSNHLESWTHDNEYTITNVNRGEWVKAKKIAADLLSYVPPYLDW